MGVSRRMHLTRIQIWSVSPSMTLNSAMRVKTKTMGKVVRSMTPLLSIGFRTAQMINLVSGSGSKSSIPVRLPCTAGMNSATAQSASTACNKEPPQLRGFLCAEVRPR